MKKGSKAGLVYDKKGNIFGFFTGSDYCAEHEFGTNKLQKNLCSKFISQNEISQNFREKKFSSLDEIKSSIVSTEERRTIDHVDALCFSESHVNGVKCATIYSNSEHLSSTWIENMLSSYRKEEAVGAWDSDSFVFRVFGEKLSKKLKVFFDSMKLGDAMFAGALSKTPEFYRENASGVMVALKSKFRPEHKEALKIADDELVSDVYLKTLSETEEILNHSCEKKVRLGFIWPDWKNGIGSEVVYKINPSYEYSELIRHAYPYTKESIMDWINSDRKSPMKQDSERVSKMKL